MQFATLRTAKACGIQDIGVKGKGQSLLGAGSLQRQLDHTVQKLFVRNSYRLPQIKCQRSRNGIDLVKIQLAVVLIDHKVDTAQFRGIMEAYLK